MPHNGTDLVQSRFQKFKRCNVHEITESAPLVTTSPPDCPRGGTSNHHIPSPISDKSKIIRQIGKVGCRGRVICSEMLIGSGSASDPICLAFSGNRLSLKGNGQPGPGLNGKPLTPYRPERRIHQLSPHPPTAVRHPQTSARGRIHHEQGGASIMSKVAHPSWPWHPMASGVSGSIQWHRASVAMGSATASIAAMTINGSGGHHRSGGSGDQWQWHSRYSWV